jgi:hypothetical protein
MLTASVYYCTNIIFCQFQTFPSTAIYQGLFYVLTSSPFSFHVLHNPSVNYIFAWILEFVLLLFSRAFWNGLLLLVI